MKAVEEHAISVVENLMMMGCVMCAGMAGHLSKTCTRTIRTLTLIRKKETGGIDMTPTATIDRTQFIGSSEIAACMGLSRWKTPLQLWSEKTGQVDSPDLSENEYVEWGSRLEAVVAEKFAEKHDVKLMAYKKRFVHPEYPFIQCELDRIIVGTDEIVEIKTANAWKYKEWQEEEDIPLEYIYQVQLALGLSKRRIGHIAVLIGGNTYLEKTIEFDQELYDQMIERAVDFWQNYVEKDVAPMATADDNSFLTELYPDDSDPELLQSGQEINDSIAFRQQLSGDIKNLIDQKNEVEAKIKQAIGENTGLLTDQYKVTWKTQNGAPKYNKKKMIEDGVFEKYAESTTRRVMRVGKNKESGKNDK
jgi:putative phage-type endonuclease